MGALLATLSSLLWGTGDFLGGTLSRRVHPLAIIRASHGLGAMVMVVVVTVAGEWGRTGAVGWGVAAGLLSLIGLATFYAALAAGTMGVVAPVAATGVVVPVGVGLARGEDPGLLALTGIVVTIVGLVLVSGPERMGRRRPAPEVGATPATPATVHAGPSATIEEAVVAGTVDADLPTDGHVLSTVGPLALAAISALTFGTAQTLVAQGAATSVALSLLSMRAATALTGTLLLATLLRRATRPARRDLPATAAIAGTDTSAVATFAVASTMGSLSISAVLASLYPAITALLAWRVHGERLRPVQVAGVVVTLTGVALLAAG